MYCTLHYMAHSNKHVHIKQAPEKRAIPMPFSMSEFWLLLGALIMLLPLVTMLLVVMLLLLLLP